MSGEAAGNWVSWLDFAFATDTRVILGLVIYFPFLGLSLPICQMQRVGLGDPPAVTETEGSAMHLLTARCCSRGWAELVENYSLRCRRGGISFQGGIFIAVFLIVIAI